MGVPTQRRSSVFAEAQRRLATTGPVRLHNHPLLSALCAAVVVFSGIGALWVSSGTDGSLAARRVLLPLSDTQWPARTAVESDMPETLVHGQGIPLPLHARNMTPGGSAEPVNALLTITSDNDGTTTSRVRLEHQQDTRHTTLVDLPDSTTGVNVTFETEDAQTPYPTHHGSTVAGDRSRHSDHYPALDPRLGC